MGEVVGGEGRVILGTRQPVSYVRGGAEGTLNRTGEDQSEHLIDFRLVFSLLRASSDPEVSMERFASGVRVVFLCATASMPHTSST